LGLREELTREWRTFFRGDKHFMLPHKTSSGDQIKEDELGGACGTCGRRLDVPTIYACVAET